MSTVDGAGDAFGEDRRVDPGRGTGNSTRGLRVPTKGLSVPWSQRHKLLKTMEVVGPGGLEPPTKGL